MNSLRLMTFLTSNYNNNLKVSLLLVMYINSEILAL